MENEEDANLVLAALAALPADLADDPATQRRVTEFWRFCRDLQNAFRTADPAIIDATVARVARPAMAAVIEAVRAWDIVFLANYVVEATAADAAAADIIVDVDAGLVPANSTLMELRDALAEVPSLTSNGLNQAVTILEAANDRRPIDTLTMGASLGGDEDEIRIDGRNATEIQAFRRFVELLGQREGGRTVLKIVFTASLFGLPDEAMGQLFGDVLPNHLTLRRVVLDIGKMPIQFFRMLTESIPTTPTSSLSSLTLTGVDLDPEILAQAVQAVVGMLRRNAAIQTLGVISVLNSEAFEHICQALPGNTNLRYLFVDVEEVSAHALVGVAESSLHCLRVRGAFAEGAVPSLAVQLRTNTTLQFLTLDDTSENRDIRDTQALLELVQTYNYTLRRIDGNLGWGDDDPLVRVHMRRNARIRSAFEELESPHPARRLVMSPDRLSSGLELVGDVPTALFKIVKLHANVILLASLQNRDRVHP